MYHVIGDPQPGAPFPELFVSVRDFKQQMSYLDSHGYQAVTQDQAEDAWTKHAKLPPKPIVLTFDDGYLGQFTDAMPILRRHGWAGVLNLKAQGSDLNTSEVKKMMAAGWELASHTIHHLDLTKLSPAALKVEVAGSRRVLRKQFGVAVDDFCYPAGRYNDAVIKAVRQAGYRGATTTDPGVASSGDPFKLKRIRISRGLGEAGFAEALSSAGASTAGVGGGG
jgi:peptidoglycan/xylan/chitin deacetylase (PgdA/CDA1 family)